MTNFAYDETIPNPSHSPAQDVTQMQVNSASIDGIIAVDHIGFGLANGGKHNQAQLATLGAIPAGLINGFETLYAKAAAGSGELYFTRGSSGTEIQMTGPGAPLAATNGYTFLPGGILVQWGLALATKNVLTTTLFVTDNKDFPNACFSVFAQPAATGAQASDYCTIQMQDSSISTTGFSFYMNTTSSRFFGIYWLAIGN